MHMKKFLLSLLIIAGVAASQVRAADPASTNAAPAAAAVATAAAAEPGAPSLEQRVAEIEAYFNNVQRPSDTAEPKVKSNISGPGPGHNAWQMTSTALVLFMTLPGLALFYGGLVRKKNVLSVMAQCLGIAGLVTILWYVIGYSFVFSAGSPYLGGTKFMFLKGVDSAPNTDYAAWVSQ